MQTGGEIGGGEVMIFGVSLKVLLAGAVGSAISVVLGGGFWWQKALRGLAGVSVAFFGHHVAAIVLIGILDFGLDAPHLPTVSEMEPVASFIAGLVGMVACETIFQVMRMVQTKAPEFVGEHLDPDSK